MVYPATKTKGLTFFNRIPFNNGLNFIIFFVVPAILGTMAFTIFSKNNNMNIEKLSDKDRSSIQRVMIVFMLVFSTPLLWSIDGGMIGVKFTPNY